MRRGTQRTTGQFDLLDEIIVDNFAGGGGASTGIELATGRIVDIAINHDPDAILMHKTNHPHTQHFQASVWDVDPVEVCRGRSVGLAWFSPDCKHFSKAKGGKPVDKKIRGLAWIVLRWAGKVHPRVIILENVEEFQTWGPVRKGRPVKAKAGQTFQKFISQIRDLGYTVEWRELVAADYGAPTTRKRLFLIARCDGRPVVWPEPTHAPRDSEAVKSGRLKPWRSAAEVIDWSLPCPSIFDSKQEIKEKYGITAVRPLAEKTMRRSIQGVDRFAIKSAEPFFVQVNHKGSDNRVATTDGPIPTMTAKLGLGVVDPVLSPITVTNTTNSVGAPADKPVHTVTSAGNQMLVCLSLTAIGQTGGGDRGRDIRQPTHTAVCKAEECLVGASLTKFYGGVVGAPVEKPMPTITAVDHNAVTVAHMMELYGTAVGRNVEEPTSTVTASGAHHAVVTTTVVKAEEGVSLGHWPEVRGLLNKYCGYELGDDEVLLLRIAGAWYFISDIGLRMLTPRELYAANGFPPDYVIDRDYLGNEYKKNKQVARCGNAVPPPLATALVRANLPEWCGEEITTMERLEQLVAV